MLVNLDERHLRSSLALWQEAMGVGRRALRGHTPGEHAKLLAQLEHTLSGCLAVLQSCSAVEAHNDGLRTLVAEVQASQQWTREGRCAMSIMVQAQR